jgi:hypothetical protein
MVANCRLLDDALLIDRFAKTGNKFAVVERTMVCFKKRKDGVFG